MFLTQVSGIGGEYVAGMVKDASTQNLSVWAMVVVLSLFLSAMIAIMKAFINSSVRTNEGIKMVIQQSSEQLHIFRESIDKITQNIMTLSEGVAKLQVFKIGEDDKFDSLVMNLDTLKRDFLDSNSNISKIVMDHDRCVHDFLMKLENSLTNFTANLLEMKAFCGVPSNKRKRIGEILIEDGVCNREQIIEAAKKQAQFELGKV